MIAVVSNALMELLATLVKMVMRLMTQAHALMQAYVLLISICMMENAYHNAQNTTIPIMNFLLAKIVLMVVPNALMKVLATLVA